MDKKDDEDMSDDSIGDDSEDGDYDQDDAPPRRHQAAIEPQEDFENEIQGGKIVPKPLPLVTPDPAVSPGPPMMRPGGVGGGASGGRTTPGFRGAPGGQKRRYSQTRGEETCLIYLMIGHFWALNKIHISSKASEEQSVI